MACGIYAITNLTTGKRYIGSSNNVKKRWNGHLSLLVRNRHYNKHLQRAWNKYGGADFDFTIVEECCKGALTERELFWVVRNDPEYNMSKEIGRPPSSLGRFLTEETRRKISMSHKGLRHSLETKRKMSEIHTGLVASPETKKRMSELLRGNKRCLGKHHSEETRMKISKATKGRASIRKGKKLSEETKRRMSAAMMGNKNSLGIRFSDEHKRRIGESLTGRHLSEEARMKMSSVRKGKSAWNKGKRWSIAMGKYI